MQVLCDVCGKQYYRADYFIKRFKHHYCSRFCYRNPVARFWDHVQKTDSCWLWAGSRKNGYGRFTVGGEMKLAHRVAWELLRGPIPRGMLVCHDCPGGDNPSCVNPEHLFIGTSLDNALDAANKGRIPKGIKHRDCKISEAIVREIRNRYRAGGISMRALAKDYGICNVGVFKIVHRLHWAHVAD